MGKIHRGVRSTNIISKIVQTTTTNSQHICHTRINEQGIEDKDKDFTQLQTLYE